MCFSKMSTVVFLVAFLTMMPFVTFVTVAFVEGVVVRSVVTVMSKVTEKSCLIKYNSPLTHKRSVNHSQ